MRYDRRAVHPHTVQTTPTTIEIKHRDTGAVLFTRTEIGNTLAFTLRIAIILKRDVRHADLTGADLSNGFFAGGDFSYCDFTEATLNGADFSHTQLDRATFDHTEGTGTNFTGIVIADIDFKRCDFTDAKFSGSTLTDIKFIRCSLKAANFDEATLNNVNLWWTYAARAQFANAVLDHLHGQYVDFSDVDFLTAKINNAFIWIGKFTGAKANPEAGFRTQKGGDTPRYKIPCVCDGPCQNCVGCEVPKKYETFGELASPGKTRAY